MAEFSAELRLPIFHVEPPHDGKIELNDRTRPDPKVVEAVRDHIETLQLERELAKL